MVQQPVGTLSGGEKARLVLAMLVWQRPNLLLLDEPTNHLDLTTREALSMALNEFEGTVMLVSHDRALLREVCDEFWLVAGGALEAVRRRPRRLPALAARAVDSAAARAARAARRGRAKPARRRAAVAEAARPRRAEPRRATTARPPPRRASSAADAAKPLKKELNQIDNRLGVLFAERDALEAATRRRGARRGAARRERPAPEGDRRADRAARGALARAQHATRRHRRIGRLTSLTQETR